MAPEQGHLSLIHISWQGFLHLLASSLSLKGMKINITVIFIFIPFTSLTISDSLFEIPLTFHVATLISSSIPNPLSHTTVQELRLIITTTIATRIFRFSADHSVSTVEHLLCIGTLWFLIEVSSVICWLQKRHEYRLLTNLPFKFLNC